MSALDPNSTRHVDAVCGAVAGNDWLALRRVLHPYLHFTDDRGRTTRGRLKVIALMREIEVLSPPDDIELREGRVYRWICVRSS
jgi:hypothetical protein